jgi:hypothetical protein
MRAGAMLRVPISTIQCPVPAPRRRAGDWVGQREMLADAAAASARAAAAQVLTFLAAVPAA